MSISTLFSIPLEICNEVYRLLLLSHLNYYSFDAPTIPDAIRLHPVIMSTCHQAYQEAYLILYRENRWIMMETTNYIDHDRLSNKDVQLNIPVIKLPGEPFLYKILIISTKIRSYFCSLIYYLIKIARMVLPLSSRALNNIDQDIWAYTVISNLHIIIQVDDIQLRRLRLEAKVLKISISKYITDCKYARLLDILYSEGARKIERYIE